MRVTSKENAKVIGQFLASGSVFVWHSHLKHSTVLYSSLVRKTSPPPCIYNKGSQLNMLGIATIVPVASRPFLGGVAVASSTPNRI